MTDHPTPQALTAVVKRALLREAAQNLAAGRRLFDGRWMDAAQCRVAERARRRTRFHETVEAVVFWTIVAVVGLGFMVVIVAIL